MKVISLRNTKKLVKGCTYEVMLLINNNNNNNKYYSPLIVIKGVGRCSPKNFILEDGNPLPEINYDAGIFVQKRIIENPENIKVGDVLKCRKPSTFLEVDKLYKVEYVDVKKVGTKYIWYEVSVKVSGYSRWLSINNFSRPSPQELRELSFIEIIDGKKPNLSVDTTTRLFDSYDSKKQNKILTSLLFRSILDPFRNNLDILDWAIKKIEPRYKLERKDFDEIMKKNIHQICLENEKSQFH